MPTMQSARMCKLWKQLLERRLFHPRIWCVIRELIRVVCKNILLSSKLIHCTFCSVVMQLYLEFLDKFERKFVTQGAWHPKHFPVTRPGMVFASHIPSRTSPPYPCKDLGSILQQECHPLISLSRTRWKHSFQNRSLNKEGSKTLYIFLYYIFFSVSARKLPSTGLVHRRLL